MKGRLNCFTKARPYLSLLYDKKDEKYLCPSGRMLEIAKYALSYQFYISQLEDSYSKPKYCSLLKDLVEPKTSKKFNAKHLKDFSLSFSKKNLTNAWKDGMVIEDSLEKGKYAGRPIKFNHPVALQDEEDEYVAHTIDLDERKENTERIFYSDQKFGTRAEINYNKSDTVRGVLYKNDGKIDVKASIDFLSKNKGDETEKSPMGAKSLFRRDSDITHSVHRLQSYRSIQHEPSNKKQYDAVSRSNYSALKSHKEKFISQNLDSTSNVD